MQGTPMGESGRAPQSSTVVDQAEVFGLLGDPATFGLSAPVRRIDTHGAAVFLAGDDAYKVKRAVRFPFMDFSTLEKRRVACEAEIAVNRPNAPGIYLGVTPIARMGAGLSLGGAGEVVEWAVHMRRFDEEATLDRLADRQALPLELIAKLASVILLSHERAPLRDGESATRALERYLDQNDEAFAARPDLFDPGRARRAGGRRAGEPGGMPASARRTRQGRLGAPLPRRSAFAQYRADRRRAGAVRRRGVR